MCSIPDEGTGDSQSRRPSLRRYASIESFAPPSRAVVRKIWSFHTIGEECPRPATAARHLTLVVSDQVSTYAAPLARPCPDGPRHRVQYAAASPATGTTAIGAAAAAWRTSQPHSAATQARRMSQCNPGVTTIARTGL